MSRDYDPMFDQPYDDTPEAILMVGDIGNGFTPIGPFRSAGLAIEYTDSHDFASRFGNRNWVVFDLEPAPATKPVTNGIRDDEDYPQDNSDWE